MRLVQRKAKNENGKEESKVSGHGVNRLHVSYPETVREKLEEIRLEPDKSSLSEVFRQALLFYALAFEEHKKGSDFLIRNSKGEIERLRMFM